MSLREGIILKKIERDGTILFSWKNRNLLNLYVFQTNFSGILYSSEKNPPYGITHVPVINYKQKKVSYSLISVNI